MTQPTKPSAGALRAAKSIIANAYGLSLAVCAEIIDRETGVAELLEAAKEYEQFANRSPWESKPFDHDVWLKRLEHAIAKCERR